MINEITEYSEDARTATRLQYAVQLTYTDGRVRTHIRENELSARNMARIHTRNAATMADWLVEKAEVVVRIITISLGDWVVAEEEGEAK